MANDGLIPLDSKELAPLTGDSASTRPLHNDEYSRTQHGIYAQWLFDIKSRPAPSSKSTSIFTRLQGMFIGPWFESHWKKLTQLATRLPLLVRLNVGLAKGNGWSFGCVLLTKFLGSFTPALQMYYDQRIVKIPKEQGTNQQLFSSQAKLEVLRMHCRLTDEQLEDPSIKRKIELLSALSLAQHGAWAFDVWSFATVLQSGLSLLLQASALLYQLNRGNAVLFALSLAFTVLPSRSYGRWDTGAPCITEVTNDNWMRFTNFFQLGTSTSPSLRREVTNLGLQDHLLTSATALHSIIGTESTTPPDDFQQPPSFYLIEHVLQLSTPITYTIFSLLQAFKPGSLSIGSFAELSSMTVGVNAVWGSWMCCEMFWRTMSSGLESLEAFYEVMDMDSSESNEGKIAYTSRERTSMAGDIVGRGMEIEFRNVTFRYPNASKNSLEDVSFVILPGELAAIVGHNGSGKSTLVALIARMLKPTSGEILINGHSINSYSLTDLHRLCSFTFQTSPALPFTIHNYVALGAVSDTHAPGGETLITSALEEAGAESLINELRDGWNTYPAGVAGGGDMNQLGWYFPRVTTVEETVEPTITISEKEYDENMSLRAARHAWRSYMLGIPSSRMEKEDGEESSGVKMNSVSTVVDGKSAVIQYPAYSPSSVTLSGGQWQKVALARRSFVKPVVDLLCWDEPAAALDALAESSLFEKILARKTKSTILFSTHRFNSCPQADRILMFSKGKLIENGTHSDLLKIDGGAYRELWEAQAKGFV